MKSEPRLVDDVERLGGTNAFADELRRLAELAPEPFRAILEENAR